MSRFQDISGAPCQSTDPEIFFPDSMDTKKIALAKSFCNKCKGQTECLSFAMSNKIQYGVWGGLTEAERYSLKRKQQRNKLNGSM